MKVGANHRFNRNPIAHSVAVRKTNIRAANRWFPLPALIALALVLVLSGHLIPGLNPRLGNMAQIPALKAPSQHDSTIWLSVVPVGDVIHVTTSDRRSFRYRKDASQLELKELIQYLQMKTRNLALSSNLAMEISPYHTVVNLAVDKRLSFAAFRPILYALAGAKISRYSFETLSIN